MFKLSEAYFNNRRNGIINHLNNFNNKLKKHNINRYKILNEIISGNLNNRENKKYNNDSLYQSRKIFQSENKYLPNIKEHNILNTNYNKINEKFSDYNQKRNDKRKYFYNKLITETNNEINNNLYKNYYFSGNKNKNIFRINRFQREVLPKIKQYDGSHYFSNNKKEIDYSNINLMKKKIDKKVKIEQIDKENNNIEEKKINNIENNYQNISDNYKTSNLDYGYENKKIIHNEYNVAFKNVIFYSSGDIIIEDEPMDMNNYNNYPLSKILNNCQIRNYEWELFPPEIAANQLKQETGNCYMVSALESISNIPGLLDYIFDKNFSPTNKSFKVNFRHQNQNVESYIVKNDFPVESNNLKFIKPLEKEAYAVIFEKVWALIRGGYSKIDGGTTYEVLNKVFGTSSNYLYNSKMGIFDIDLKKYKLEYKLFDENLKDIEILYEDIKRSDKEWIKKISEYPYNQRTIDPELAFEKIKNAEHHKVE